MSSSLITTPALTFCFVEQSTSGILHLSRPDTTLGSVRAQVRTSLQNHLEGQWGIDKTSVIHSEPQSVVIVSDTQGFLSCQDDNKLASDVCGSAIIALVPSPSQLQKKKRKGKGKSNELPVNMTVLTPFLQKSPLLDKKNYHRDQSQPSRDENNASLAAILQRLQELERTTDELKQDNIDLKRQVVDLKRDNINLKQDNVDLKQQIVDLKRDNTNLKQQIVDLKRDNNKLKQDNNTLKQDNNTLKQDNNKLKQQVVELMKRNDLLAAQLEQERAARIADNKQLAKLTTENVSLRRQLDEIEKMQQDHSEWIHSQDSMMLDGIKARHLLTVAQAKLAIAIGVATPSSRFRAANAWRDAIGPSADLLERLAKARDHLKATHVQLDMEASQFVQSEAGMRLVCEHLSSIRTTGDNAAHPSDNHVKLFRDAVLRHAESEGLTAIMNFVCLH